MKHVSELLVWLVPAVCFAQANNVIFHASFDGSVEPSVKADKTKITQNRTTDEDFFPGLKGKALRIGADADGKNAKSVTWTAQGNILPAKGTISFYFKMLDWQKFPKQFQHLFMVSSNRPPMVSLSPAAAEPTVVFYEGSGKASVRLKTRLEPDDAWHHWAAVWNEKQLKFYLDGKRVGVRDRDFVEPEKHWKYLSAGAQNWGEEHVKGYTLMDELTIYSEELGEDQIKGLADALKVQP